MNLRHEDSDHEEGKHEGDVRHSPTHSKSNASSRVTLDDIERASIQDREFGNHANEKGAGESLELKKTVTRASNVLERVFTTRSIVDPPPPPDGGLQAWTMVACGWLVIFTTWVGRTITKCNRCACSIS